MKSSTSLCFVLTLLLSQSAVHADGLYKWKDARGQIQYGDKPPANVNAQPVALPKITIIDNYANQWKPMRFNELNLVNNSKKEEPKAQIKRSNYSKLAFLAPKQGQGIRANNGDVSAMISIKPPLKKGHQLVFSVDGKMIGKGKSRTQNFVNLDRGSHTIDVKVIDDKGITLKSSSVGFNVLRSIGDNKTSQIPQAKSFNELRKQQTGG